MDVVLNHTFQRQINGWYCGPASVRVALSCKGIEQSQDQLASQLGTTVNGTDSSWDVARVLNAWFGEGTHSTYFIGGTDATVQQTIDLRWLAVSSINKGFAVVANAVGPISPLDYGQYSYWGGHYVAITGYQRDGELFLVSDVNVREYWVTVEQLATWIAGRGFTYHSAAVPAAPAPPAAVPAPPAGLPDDDKSTLFLIDIASYQQGLNLEAAKAQGVELVNIKTSEGAGYTWNGAKAYADEARRLGLGISTFHWVDSSTDGITQARRAYELMKSLGNGSTDGMAHQCDCEDDASYQIVVDYITEFQRLLGRPVYFYSGDWWLEPRGWDVAHLTPYLMAAPNAGYLGSYPGDDSAHWAAGYGGYSVLSGMQYAVSPIPGAFSGDVSKTMFRRDAWLALTGQAQEVKLSNLVAYQTHEEGGPWYISNGVESRKVPSGKLGDKDWLHEVLWWLRNTGFTVTQTQQVFLKSTAEGLFGPVVGEITIPPINVPPAEVNSEDIVMSVKKALREGTAEL